MDIFIPRFRRNHFSPGGEYKFFKCNNFDLGIKGDDQAARCKRDEDGLEGYITGQNGGRWPCTGIDNGKDGIIPWVGRGRAYKLESYVVFVSSKLFLSKQRFNDTFGNRIESLSFHIFLAVPSAMIQVYFYQGQFWMEQFDLNRSVLFFLILIFDQYRYMHSYMHFHMENIVVFLYYYIIVYRYIAKLLFISLY